MPIQRLKPLADERRYARTPQCSAPVNVPDDGYKWRTIHCERRGYNVKRCQRSATVEITGKPYCQLHASKIALRLWLDDDLVEKEGTNG